jgi:hypothetical protein
MSLKRVNPLGALWRWTFDLWTFDLRPSTAAPQAG